GGLVGTLISRGLASGLNTVGATVILIAAASTGLLLATNFSFLGLYEKLVSLAAGRFGFVRTIPARLKAWREARRQRLLLRKEQREALKAEQLAARSILKISADLTPEERIAQFLKDDGVPAINGEVVNRGETASVLQATTIQASAEPARAAAAG